jgi:DNA-binding transcriptional MerR regulator
METSPPSAADSIPSAPEHIPASDRPSDSGGPVPRPIALLTTGEMARMSNNTLRTVRFYEEEGILRPARRTEGGHRLFDPSELDRLMLVSDMRLAGLSLEDIKKILLLKRSATSGEAASHEASRVLTLRIDELKEKVAVLTRLRDDLVETKHLVTGCLECHDEKFPDHCDSCSVVTSQSSLSRSARVLWSVGSAARPAGPKPATEARDEGETGST